MTDLQALHSIGVVERDTGIGRDTLRIWERRYGFPAPTRNDKGERLYDDAQLRRLQRIRRLIDQGLRPGKLLPLDDPALDALEAELSVSTIAFDASITALLEAVQTGDRIQLEILLRERCQTLGLRDFILCTVAPLVHTVGEQWASGKLQVYQEHFVSAQLTAFLSAEVARLPEPAEARPVLLMTLSGEQHTLGLIMVHALLVASGVKAVNLGAELPMDQLVQAVQQFDASTVGLTFSSAYPYKHIRPDLQELRALLPHDVQIWVGGEGVRRLRKLPAGVRKFTDLEQLPL